jgi:predicted kinase
MLCGKVAAGKSTLSTRLITPGTVVIAQDHWMSKLYKEELQTVADYIRLVPRLRDAMAPHLVDLLRARLSVVLDWPANTVASRAWMRGVFEAAGAAHKLHVLDVTDEVCLARLQARNAEGRHEYQVSRAEFDELSRHFEPPTPAEGFDIVLHRQR